MWGVHAFRAACRTMCCFAAGSSGPALSPAPPSHHRTPQPLKAYLLKFREAEKQAMAANTIAKAAADINKDKDED